MTEPKHYEIHCQKCGTLIRTLADPPTSCPDCGDVQAIHMIYLSPEEVRVQAEEKAARYCRRFYTPPGGDDVPQPVY